MKKLRVLILGGGPSSEHEISLKTAEMVHKHLDSKKYVPMLASISKKGRWELPISKIKSVADIVFIAMHGEFGEDGTVQKILDDMKLPYTGSGFRASALGMDKLKSRRIFESAGMTIPMFVDSFPAVVKPSDHGSSVGVSIVKKREDLSAAIKNAKKYSKNVMVEEFIHGTELTCGVLDDGKNNLMPLLPTEIVPKMGAFFDYASKYTESGSEEITPARVPPKILKECQDTALRAHIAVGCSGFSRSDMIWHKESGLPRGKAGKIYILEINTIPGLTRQSLLPKAAAASGISFSKLLDRLIESALRKN